MKVSIAVFVFLLSVLYPLTSCAADSSDDGSDKTYYWQGSQLNNLNRLGTSGDFEQEQKRHQDGKDADQYLTSIREQMAHQSQKDAQQKTTLAFQGQLPGNPIELTYLSPGVRVTLHADALFDENTATMKTGSVDTLNRLQTILETETQKPLQFVISDAIGAIPDARSLEAERSLVVLSMLQMPDKAADQEDLTPETLSR